MADHPDRRPAEPEHDPLAGTVYRVTGLLGHGGMGRVYEAVHSELGKPFVVKVLSERLSADPALIDRMRFEAQTLARLDHPNIVKVTDMGRLPTGSPFIVMERLVGRTLTDELRARGRLPVLEAIGWARQLCLALAEAHAIGIVHRDIKLDNLFLHEPPDGPRLLKVLDFGIAKALPGVSDRTPKPPAMPTEEGVLVGTPRYLSPEAARGEKVDQRADLYSTGIVLYLLLTGRHPFHDAEGVKAFIAAHATREPEPPSLLTVDPVPAELDRLVLRTLAKDPVDRPASAAELDRLLARVEEALQRPVGFMETTTFDPDVLAKLSSARPPPPPATAPATPILMTTKPEAPTAVKALADTAPMSAPMAARVTAPAPRVVGAPERRAPRALTPLILMVLSALLVVAIGIWMSR